jgi:hypothetical protein
MVWLARVRANIPLVRCHAFEASCKRLRRTAPRLHGLLQPRNGASNDGCRNCCEVSRLRGLRNEGARRQNSEFRSQESANDNDADLWRAAVPRSRPLGAFLAPSTIFILMGRGLERPKHKNGAARRSFQRVIFAGYLARYFRTASWKHFQSSIRLRVTASRIPMSEGNPFSPRTAWTVPSSWL